MKQALASILAAMLFTFGASALSLEAVETSAEAEIYSESASMKSESGFTAESLIYPGTTGTGFTVTSSEAVEWQIDVGYSEATYTVSADKMSATVTSVGYSGKITFAADFSDGRKTLEVSFVNGEKWKPGLNTYTGTPDSFGFENVGVGFTLSDYFRCTNAWEWGTNDLKDGINTSANAIYTIWKFNYIYPKNDFSPAIEADRPIAYAYDRLANNGGYILVNNDGKPWANVASTGGVWKHEAKTILGSNNPYSSGNVKEIRIGGANGNYYGSYAAYLGNNDRKFFYVDNISTIPYYKVTYYSKDGTTVLAEKYVDPAESTYTVDASLLPEDATGFAEAMGGDAVTSVSLAYKDVSLYAVKGEKITFTDGTNTYMTTAADGFVFPTTQECGFETENFLVWYNVPSGLKFRAGEKLDAAGAEKVSGMEFIAYCQNVNVSAMGYAYEGDIAPSGTNKFRYTENIEDEGRNVLHLRQYQTNKYASDARVFFRQAESFDSKEYNIIQYSYKIGSGFDVTDTSLSFEDITDSKLKKPETGLASFYFFAENSANGYIYGGKACQIGSWQHTLINDNAYHVYELDMENTPSAGWATPWFVNGNEGRPIYGFAIDPNMVNYSGDTYIDYIRVYRDGIFTVTYDTNIPEGYEDFVQAEVDPDTGRGVGTGYMLTGEQPIITGFAFRGWATTPDATVEDVVDSINLTGDTTVYAVWTSIPASPKVDKSNINIRSGADNVNGIRFSASVAARNKAMLDEYGFIIAREDVLGSNELTFLFKKKDENKPLYVYGAAYDKKNGLDIQYDVSGSNIIFTAVCTNIPAEHYATKLVARTYAKYAVNGNAFTVYGDSVVKSIKEVAQSIKDAGGAAYEDNKDYIDSILA